MTPLAAWIVSVSTFVTDAAGHPATKPIDVAGAEAIAKRCEGVGKTFEEQATCGAVYLVHSFLESGYNLLAVSRTDCRDHLTGKFYTVPWGETCRPGDEPVSFGPFQTGKKPKDWEEAVAIFTPLLIKSATTCLEPLAMVASGSCTNKAGIAISKSRMAKARKLVADHPFKPEDKS